ncbi:AAA family ATPase [Fictibacillus phosphorivorans]|uniref:AAA family ATPase n=1 Tax=Fictibacillus phosphorivorans TaxID=1221500 RepID=UPI0011A53B5B|nr:AAA family ATPase [Fictibacillus phosphorivorans]
MANFATLFTDDYFQIATNEYQRFKEYSPYYDEAYKKDILTKTNEYLTSITISKDNVVEVIKYLDNNNPQSGSFVHWNNLKDLLNYAQEKPEDVSLLLNHLYDSSIPLNERINEFIANGKKFNPKIKLGTPLFGYLLAAYDYLLYPIYKEEVFKDFLTTFEIDEKVGSFSLGEKYQFYVRLCKLVLEKVSYSNWNMLDVQDFIYCLSQYYDLITNTAVKFINYFAKRLKYFKDNPSDFLQEIQNLDYQFLESLKRQYSNTEKVNKIRYEVLDSIIARKEMDITKFEELKTIINSQYETNIINSWSNFTILFPLYYSKFKNKIVLELSKIHNAIQHIEELDGFEFTPNKIINDFTWRQNFGSTDIWLAVYPKDKVNHKVAGQLFFRIDESIIEYGLFAGTEMGIGETVNDITVVSDVNEFTYEEMKNRFVELIPKYKALNEKEALSESVQEDEKPYLTNDELNYFWITAKPSIWTVDKIKDGSNIFYTAYNLKGNKRRIFTAFEKVKPGDKIVFYESTPRKEIVALGEVVQRMHKGKTEDYAEGEVEGITLRYVEDINPISWTKLIEVEELKDSNPIKNGAQGSLFELTKEEFEIILSLEELDEISDAKKQMKNYFIPTINLNDDLNIENLYFDNKTTILRQVKTALKNGKHIIFTGPPGTGKSKLAKEICDSINVKYTMSTATSDWSTFETIGGYRPTSEGNLLFKPGLFLECIKNSLSMEPQMKWLIIDELNRADIDKAFGALFSALTGDPITLSFESISGENIVLRPQGKMEETISLNDYEYVIPNDWRIIGTMNTYDKSSLYELSYAFMRRFAFIPITIPSEITEELVQSYLNVWGIENNELSGKLTKLWEAINKYKKIGPAILKDIALHIVEDDDITSAVIMYVLPQFEGLQIEEINQFIEDVNILSDVEDERLLQFAGDFF